MSIFEILMLICFGSAWPMSIHKMLKTKRSDGKSIPFLIILAMGYVFGVIHKVKHNFDPVTVLYAVNFVMISIDIYLVKHYQKNRSL